MDPHPAGTFEGLLLALPCAVIGSLFAAADAALGSLNPARLTVLQQAATGRRQRAFERYAQDRAGSHTHWLVGRMVFTALAALLVANWAALHVARSAPAPVGALSAVLTYGVVAEAMTTLARARPEAFANLALGVIRPLEWLVLPLSAPIALVGGPLRRWLETNRHHDPRITETEVEWLISEGQKQGSLGQEPAEMIRHVLELKDLAARDVMVPRTRVSAIEAGTNLADALRFVSNEGHSRYPVYRGTIDNVVGLLYAKDLFRILVDGKLQHLRLEHLIRTPAIFVPEAQGLSSVLREMRARRQHLAVVIDEFGGISGIVTLEDILEVIVGEIRDEYDTEEAPIQELGDGRLLADAAVSVHDLASYLGALIPNGADYESLGGLLIHQTGGVPLVGTQLEAHGLSFIVREGDEKRVAKVEIIRTSLLPEAHAPSSATWPASTPPQASPTSPPPSSSSAPPASNGSRAEASASSRPTEEGGGGKHASLA